MKLKGFTLTEVLIVIAILSVLSSMILPVYSKAREKARETETTLICRQIYMAMVMYKTNTGTVPDDITQLASYLPGIDLSQYEIDPTAFPVQ